MHKTLIATLLALAPRAALACPVCFGQNDSPLASAMNLGIFTMLGVVGAVIVGFATFFVHLIRRARLAADAGPAWSGNVPAEQVRRFGQPEAGDYAPNVPNV